MAAVAVGVGVLTVLQAGVAAAVVAALMLTGIVLALRGAPASTDLSTKRFRWVALAWAFLIIEPIGHFTTGRTTLTAVAGVPSAENVIELATYGMIGAGAAWSMRRNGVGGQPPWLLLALPALSLLSAAWSVAGTVTLGFGFELIATVLLAWLSAGILERNPPLGRAVIRQMLRFVVEGVALLSVVGLVFRSGWTLPGEVPRFTWPGTHPLVAGADVGCAFLILVFGGRGEAGFSWRACIVLLGLFGTCLYLGQARTALAGVVIASLFGCWRFSKRAGAARRLLGAAVIATTVAVVATSFGGPLTQYIYRGQSQQQVLALNGRLGLWSFGLGQLHGLGRWLVGYGLGGTRVLLANSVAWAGDVHSAWLELLLSLGLVGIAVGAVLIAALAVRLLRSAGTTILPSHTLLVMFVYVLAMSPVAAGFAAPGPEPGLGFAVLALCCAAVPARQPSVYVAKTTSGGYTEPEVYPVPA